MASQHRIPPTERSQSRTPSTLSSRWALIGFAALSACEGTGSVRLTTWGEEYIEQAIPAATGDTVGFADGWRVSFTKFLLTVKSVSLGSRDAAKPEWTLPEPMVFDLTRKGPAEIAVVKDLPARRLDAVSYTLAFDGAAKNGNGAAEADLAQHAAGGYTLSLAGVAERGAERKTFEWGFSKDTRYEACKNEELGGLGVAVPTGAVETVELTIHGDHLFYDDLQSPDAVMRFDAMAGADRDGDGAITLDELKAVNLTALPADRYGTGGASGVKTLADFVGELSRTVGHYRAEGECSSVPVR